MMVSPSKEADRIKYVIQESLEPDPKRKVRAVLAEAFASIRSSAVNDALATVTFETLMGEQILRNGESDKSKASEYNPYAYDPAEPLPVGIQPGKPANYAGGSDTNRATKIEQIKALQNEIDAVVDQVLNTPMVEIADASEYSDDEVEEVE
jgi:hypothetical protein